MRITSAIILLGIMLLSPVVALATEFQQFRNTVKKSASETEDATPPVVCLCKDANLLLNTVGQLLSSPSETAVGTRLAVLCIIPHFNLQGSISGTTPCQTWEYLPKP